MSEDELERRKMEKSDLKASKKSKIDDKKLDK